MATTFKKTGPGWKKLEKALHPSQITTTVNRHLSAATKLNALLAIAKIRRSIASGNFKANRPLTAALKGDNKPLVGTKHAQLYNSVTSKEIDPITTFVGVLRTAGVFNVAVTVHEGKTIKVTKKMRGLFEVLAKASQGRLSPSKLEGRARELWEEMPGGWKPLHPSTNYIIIPARPFIKAAFADGELKKLARQNWKQALAAAYREMAGR
jgi:hypothetical protein